MNLEIDAAYYANLFGTESIRDMLFQIFLPIGYLVFFIVWSLGLGKRAISLELYDGKTIIKEGMRLVGGLLFISIVPSLLDLIDRIAISISSSIFVQETEITAQATDMSKLWDEIKALLQFNIIYEAGQISITGFDIGTALQKIYAVYSSNLVYYCAKTLLSILNIIVAIKLGVRALKLAIMGGTAPVFIAMSTNDDTKQYTQNFIVNYLLIALEVVFIRILTAAYNMAMLSHVDINKIFNESKNLGEFIFSTDVLSIALITIVFAFMILTADRMFAKMINK